MTDEEMAEEYASSSTSDRGYYYEGLKEGFLDGLKEGRPKWHKVADGDLPKENYFVLVLNKRTGYEIARHAPFEEYYLDNWVTIDNRSLIQTKNNQTVIAWCEIPTYTEE